MAKRNESLQVLIDVDSDTFSKKLRAISKHLTALADELDEIDAEQDEPESE